VNNPKLVFGTMPIGNLDDLTYNLANHIKKAEILAVENEKTIKEIIDRYELNFSGEIISFSPKDFMTNGITHDLKGLKDMVEKIPDEVIKYVFLNKNVLCLSDEGSAIVQDPFDTTRQLAISKGIKYKILPGPSSIIDSLCYSRLYYGQSFSFYGMVFYDKNKKYIYENIKNSQYPSVIFYHHEIQDIFFKELLYHLGAEREITLLSNLTTENEFMMEGKLSNIMDFVLKNTIVQPTLVISGKSIK
jgi:16S rRNA C1402 (ribose-2'-O) methylase RsmI